MARIVSFLSVAFAVACAPGGAADAGSGTEDDAGSDAFTCAADDCPYSSYLCLGGVIVQTPQNPLLGCVPPGWTCPSFEPIDAAAVPCAARGCDPSHGPVFMIGGDAAQLCLPDDAGPDGG